MHEPYDEPTKVTAVDGEVHLDGPDGVSVSITPEAAVETSNRLYEAAAVAKGQQILQENDAALLKRRREGSSEA